MAILELKAGSCNQFGGSFEATIDDSLYPFTISVGDVYYMEFNSKGKIIEGCFSVNDIFENPMGIPNTTIIGTSYGVGDVGCEACLIASANSLIFRGCFEGGIYNVDITEFPTLPTLGDTFLLDFLVSQELGIGQIIGCFFYDGFSSQQPNVFLNGKTGQTDCETCLLNSPLVYQVTQCNTETSFYISFPSNQFEGHLITFTDTFGLTQYCGIVGEQISNTINATLISDLGVYDVENNNCDDCLAISSVKKKLRNCLNPSEEIIVWASSLFQAGDSTNISTANGCYEILPDVVPPSTPVDVNELANYDPQQNCEDCLECFGVEYSFISCEQLETCGPTTLRNFSNVGSGGRGFVIENSTSTFAYVTLSLSNLITKIDLISNTIVDTTPFSIPPILNFPIDVALSNYSVLCAVNSNNGNVVFYNSNNLSQYTLSPTSLPGCNEVYFNPNDGFFYVVGNKNAFTPPIKVYSGTSYNTMVIINTFGVLNVDYRGIVQVGSLLYLLNRSNSSIDVYNSTTYTFINSYSFGFADATDLSWDGGNLIYIFISNTSVYVKFNISLLGFSSHPFSVPCVSSGKIHVNSSTNRLYMTHFECAYIYEFDTTTDTLINTYQLNSFGLNQPWDIQSNGTDTWFSSFQNLFKIECTNNFVTGSVSSNEKVDVGNVFYNYELQACCEITDIAPSPNFALSNEYISLVSFNDCSECTGTTLESFYCVDCTIGQIEAVLVAPSGQYSPNQFIKSHWGNSHFLCFEILEPYDQTIHGTDLVSFDAENAPSYTTCEECTASASIGLTLINCDTLVPIQVNVSLSDWLNIVGFFNFPSFVVSDINGTCYQVANVCPIDDNNPPFQIANFYPNQTFCRIDNRIAERGPISAGTEYFACQVCCPCGTGQTITSVAVPHPTWTTQFGNSVTLLDAVVLGGPNGLNS